jgi:hypothetical protein
VALPALSNLFGSENSFPPDIVNLLVELMPSECFLSLFNSLILDVFTSTNDSTHENGAKIFAHILYLADSNKRDKLLNGAFGIV